jgi:hypothetical protein
MAQACSICVHPQRAEIDKLLVDNASSNRVIARQFRVGHDAVQRHRQNHLPVSLTKAKAVEQVADATTLLSQVTELLQQAKRLTDAAEHAKDLRTALNGCRAVATTLGLLGQVSGELKSSMSVTTNVVVALMGLNDSQVKEKLEAAGHHGWLRVNPSTPARNELEIFALLAKGLRGSTQDEIRRILIDAGNCEAFLANPVTVMNPSQSSSKPN